MFRVSRRLVPCLLLVGLAIAACTAPVAAVPRPAASQSPASDEPASVAPTAAAPVGRTHVGVPDVSVEPLGDATYRVTVRDPAAKAWRVVVSGVEELAGGSLAVVVETSDVGYAVAVERRSSATSSTRETALDEPNVEPICEPALHACLAPEGVRTAGDPSDHTLRVLLTLDPRTTVAVAAGVADWPDEPFELGTWSDAESLTLGG